MSTAKPQRPKARLPRGFRDRTAAEIAAERKALDAIRNVYESYGFEPLETPAFEYTDALGKFLPDVDRPNEGVFSLKDDDEQWLSLRYDLTAPLARYVAENFQNLPKPFRRYQVGTVWRNEKPGPGRYREFTQFDADTVGTRSPAADAELLMMVCRHAGGAGPEARRLHRQAQQPQTAGWCAGSSGVAVDDRARRGIVLRAIDKLDRLGVDGVSALLGRGPQGRIRRFHQGRGASAEQAIAFWPSSRRSGRRRRSSAPDRAPGRQQRHRRSGPERAGTDRRMLQACGYGPDRVRVRHRRRARARLLHRRRCSRRSSPFPVKNEEGEEVVFGSVGGRRAL